MDQDPLEDLWRDYERRQKQVDQVLIRDGWLLLLYLSPLCMVFTIIYLKQTMFVGYIVLQLFCIYNRSYM
jgi:hypothetical protein